MARWPLLFKAIRTGRFERALAASPHAASSGSFEWPPGAVVPWRDFPARRRAELALCVEAMERKRPSRPLRTPRTRRYLDWRYGGHPHLVYGARTLSGQRGSKALTVLRANRRRALREVVVSELWIEDVASGRDLLEETGRCVGADYLVAFFAPGTPEHESALAAGFLPVEGQEIVFTVRVLTAAPPDPLDPSVWDLSLGDLEVF